MRSYASRKSWPSWKYQLRPVPRRCPTNIQYIRVMASSATLPDSTFTLIIGAGPIGLFTAIALAQHGYRSVVVERKAQRSMQQPKAHAINARTLEILGQAGLSIPIIRELSAPSVDAEVLRFEQSLAGKEYGQFNYERQDEAVKEFVPEPLTNIAQPILEELLQAHALATGLVTMHYGCQWQSCTQESPDSIRSEVLDLSSKESVAVQSRYLLACDGAHSRARAAFGIQVRTPKSTNPTYARYISATLTADWRKYRSGMLHVIIQDEKLRVFIVYDRSSTWVLMFGIPRDDPVEKYTEEYCREAIDRASPPAVGEKVSYKVVNICAWEAITCVADFYRSPKFPRAFLLGDAAHTFPNAGGLGINTGIADVQNLVWKIHVVERGWAAKPDALLDTYTSERRPVAEISCKISDHNQTRVRRIAEQMSRNMSNPEVDWKDPEKRKLLQDTINAQWSFSDHLNLHLGYIYGQEDLGLAPEGGEQIPANSLFYKPRCVPGVRVPHGWITREGEKLSTINLVTSSAFTVFAASSVPALPAAVECPRGIPIVYQQVGRDFTEADAGWSTVMGFNAGRKLVVVRPDHHILGFAETVEGIGQLLLQSLEIDS
ncbi:hypothetical protein FE257_006705 [Aspergillus nanangensis]|uniref:FAD-binding domain-containing protein n=1 Tax=Aspergillus nanangensis TaxID=2582783 RepID=A0AAD4CP03_ASPNN|nr:hypothetical protein FE257_006705 [Aspergillus nanangensis]